MNAIQRKKVELVCLMSDAVTRKMWIEFLLGALMCTSGVFSFYFLLIGSILSGFVLCIITAALFRVRREVGNTYRSKRDVLRLQYKVL